MIHSYKILLADDDAEDRFIMNNAFTQLGLSHCVEFAEDGEDAISYLEKMPHDEPLPALVVLDQNMPRLNGTQTLQKIKSNRRLSAIPIIIFSTSISPNELEECMQMGAISYVTKPNTFDGCVFTAQRFYDFCVQGTL